MAKKKNQSNNNENKENGGRVEVVLKVDLHCRGCAGKIVEAVCSFDGVESVKIGDMESNKIRVVGEVDPEELRWKVEEKLKKKVELISPAKKKVKFIENNNQFNGDGGAMKDEPKTTKFPVTTTVLKVSLDCQGCVDRIQQLISKTKGFKDMSIDTPNNLVAVKGGMDVNALREMLKDKLNRKVEIVQQKEDGGSGGKKKGKGGGVGGEGGGVDRRIEEHVMENNYFPQGQVRGRYVNGPGYTYNYMYPQNVNGPGYMYNYMYPQHVNGPGYVYNYMYATQMFNDENPNACVVM